MNHTREESILKPVLGANKCPDTLHSRFQRRKRQGSRQSGQATTELALILPVLFFLLLGLTEYAWLINNEMVMANAAREAARSAALGQGTNMVCTQATNVASPLTIHSITLSYSTNNGTSWSTTNWPAETVSTNGSTSTTNNGLASGSLIQVNVTAYDIELTKSIPQLNNFLIRQTAIMTRE